VSQDDHEWVRRAQAGDRQAYAALVERYRGRVWGWLVRLTGDPELADDVTQEALLKAWKALGSFLPGASFRAWLFGIARHALVDARRGPRGVAPRPLPESLAGREPPPDQAAVEREGEALLLDACAALPEHFRAPFLLWAQEELSFAEVAEALGLAEPTARWRVFKARLLLVERLGKYLDRKVP
jgi:RNA polymerase sigma-70 factor (ECF subfamily)